MKATLKTIAGQPSWVVRSRQVELAVTQMGGHMAPVTFCRDTAKPVQPYHISPWQGEKIKMADKVLRPLRGDLFCMPFGANAEVYRGEKHALHGEVAGERWKFVAAERSAGVTTLTLSMRTKVRPGKVTKQLSLLAGQNVVYVRHVLEGFSGKMPLGHHATLALPEKEGSVRVATSPFRFGATSPVSFGSPADGQYPSFVVNKRFRDLRRVPLMWKDPSHADCTSFPARAGFSDLLAVFSKRGIQPAWTTAVDTVNGFLWFALKDPTVLPATVFWIANGGHHGSPFSGRNRCLGLEDVCAYFTAGVAGSARSNPLSKLGVPTALTLSPRRPTAIHYIQGAVKVDRAFKQVRAVEFAPGRATFVSTAGKKVTAAVNHDFLQSGELA